MLRKVFTAMGVSVVLVGWASSARAGSVPTALTEQGRLLDASNNPITTAVTMTFAIYNAATGGTPATALWTEKQTITPDNGFFSAELGSVTALPPAIFTGQNLWLGLTVNTDAEMTPRQPMVSVPYAITAQNVIGNITPASVAIGATAVIDATGHWVGPNTGLVGATGPQGNPGTAGATGAKGDPGGAGATGPQGSPGVQGPTGPQGASIAGPTGPQGSPGGVGPTGPAGPGGVMGHAGLSQSSGASATAFLESSPFTPSRNMSCHVTSMAMLDTNGVAAGTWGSGAYATIRTTAGVTVAQSTWVPEYPLTVGGNEAYYNSVTQSIVGNLTAGTAYAFGCNFLSIGANIQEYCDVNWVCF